MEHADAPHSLRLLRTRHERPSRRRAGNERDELAAPDACPAPASASHQSSRLAWRARQHGPNRANRGIKLFVRHVLKALGMLNPHFLRHQHCADLEIAGRTFPAHPLKHLAPMQLPILRQIGEKVLVKRPPRSLW